MNRTIVVRGKFSSVFAAQISINILCKVYRIKLDLLADTDHSKYFIVYKRLVIFGGMNIADEYRYEWHDYMVKIQNGKWAQAFEDKVMNGYKWPAATPLLITVNDRYAAEVRTAIIEVMDNTQERLFIEHAYFSDSKVKTAVERTADRGVTVDIILPEKPDTLIFPTL